LISKQSRDCWNPRCESVNGKVGTWRNDKGQKGGEKGWCSKCLKALNERMNEASNNERVKEGKDWSNEAVNE
jgi:hypothetical protein